MNPKEKLEPKSLVKRAPVFYYPNFLDEELSNKLYEELKTVNIERHTHNGKKLARNTAVFGDTSKLSKFPEIWGEDVEMVNWSTGMPTMEIVLNKVRSFLEQEFNICLVNQYPSGKDFIGWHADNEEKGDKYCIASISLGAVRKFLFLLKIKDLGLDEEEQERVEVELGHGSLLVMKHPCQDLYLHSLPPDKKVKDERINLTYRIFHYDQ